MKTISSMEEYLYLIDETVFDASDLLAAQGDDDNPDGNPLIASVEAELQALQQSVIDGSYQFADEDLPFVDMIKGREAQIPFAESLRLINQVHRNGLDA